MPLKFPKDILNGLRVIVFTNRHYWKHTTFAAWVATNTCYSPPLNPASSTTSFLFNSITALAPHLLSHLADHSHYLHYKSPTALFDVLHPICGISFLLHFVSLVPVILWIHSSSHMSHLCHPSLHFHHPLLLHSFTIHLKPTYSKNPSHHSLFFLPGLPQRTHTRTGLSASWFLLFLFFFLC